MKIEARKPHIKRGARGWWVSHNCVLHHADTWGYALAIAIELCVIQREQAEVLSGPIIPAKPWPCWRGRPRPEVMAMVGKILYPNRTLRLVRGGGE